MFMGEVRSKSVGRIAVGVILSLWILGCHAVQEPSAEPQATTPSASIAPAAVAPPAGQNPFEAFKALLSDRRAKPVMLGAGGLLAAILLTVGLAKILRGDAPEAQPANNGSVRGA